MVGSGAGPVWGFGSGALGGGGDIRIVEARHWSSLLGLRGHLLLGTGSRVVGHGRGPRALLYHVGVGALVHHHLLGSIPCLQTHLGAPRSILHGVGPSSSLLSPCSLGTLPCIRVGHPPCCSSQLRIDHERQPSGLIRGGGHAPVPLEVDHDRHVALLGDWQPLALGGVSHAPRGMLPARGEGQAVLSLLLLHLQHH